MTMRRIDSLQLHPDAVRVPPAGDHDLAALRRSLEENGQQDPIDITRDGLILDGRTRWTLLRELDFDAIEVRVVDVADQTAYIVDRALSRRHLTADQKRALNSLMRQQVIDVVLDPGTGEEVKIGMGQVQRAEKLGVGRMTVRRWDAEEPVPNDTGSPTHQVRSDGRVLPLKLPREAKPKSTRGHRGQRAVKPKRHVPKWTSYFTKWCRNTARPEDRALLRRLDEELHAAIAANDLTCIHLEDNERDVSVA